MRDMKIYPCDGPDGYCPYAATEGINCYNHCGLGADEDSISEVDVDVE